MAWRDTYPEARIPDSRVRLTLTRGTRARSLAMRPALFYVLMSLLPLLAIWYLGATLYLVFRDDMLASLMRRQAEMQYRYEDRIAGLRVQLEREASRQLVNQTTIEAEVHELTSRQVQLENRASLVAALADRASAGLDTVSTMARTPIQSVATAAPVKPSALPRTPNPLLSGAIPSGQLPASISAFAPVEARSAPLAAAGKPRPESFELRLGPHSDADMPSDPKPQSDRPAARDDHAMAIEPVSPLPQTLAWLTGSMDYLEKMHLRVLGALQLPAINEAARIRAALAQTGLSTERLEAQRTLARSAARGDGKADAVGGPYVPLKVDADGSAFGREAAQLQDAILTIDRLRRIIPHVPLRQPLPGQLEVSSSFGARIDPFLGRPALHTGVDLKGDFGANVRATAAGKVISAERDGGYGNMVEIDHGNGLTTRYAHLSSISVALDQWIEPGQVVGQIGATGRATGPHLHYETRIDGEAVDPTRFLKASSRLYPNG